MDGNTNFNSRPHRAEQPPTQLSMLACSERRRFGVSAFREAELAE